MIETIMYLLLTLQVFLLFAELLVRHVHILAPIWLIFIALGISAMFALIVFVIRFNKLLTFIFILLMDFALVHFSMWVNFIPFIALYLYILGLLREREILTAKLALILSPLVLLGFIPAFSPGLLESAIGKKVHSFLYSTGNFSASNPIVNHINAEASTNAGNSAVKIALKTTPSIAKKMPGFQSFIISLVLLLAVSIGILFLAKFYQTEGKRTFYKVLFTGIAGIITVIAVASFIFFKFIHSVRLAIEAAARSSVVPSASKNPGSALPSTGQTITISKILSNINAKALSNLLNRLGLLLGILTILGGIFLFYIVYKTFFVDDVNTTLITKKESTKFLKSIRKKGIKETLKEIKNKDEYVRFLYFSVLYILQKKGVKILKYETPNEFYLRVNLLTEGPIMYFDFLTNIFNQVKYGQNSVSEDNYNFLKSHSGDIISSVENVRMKDVSKRAKKVA